jgi:toxin ParE1/3/4
MNVIYAPRAQRDLKEITAYLSERNPSASRRVLASIKSNIDTLQFFPRIGAAVDKAGHRRLPVVRYPYAIFYRIDDEEIFILHIRHTSRAPIDPEIDL